MKLIQERAFANQDQMVTGDLHETYYQVYKYVLSEGPPLSLRNSILAITRKL